VRGRTAIVTGAGSGIGRALALAFAGAGARVACVGRRAEALDATVVAIATAGGEAVAIPTDITDPDHVERMVASVLERYGSVGLLFNAAGSFASVAPIWDADPDAWWRDVSVNLRGTFLCTRAVLPHLRAQGHGVIINMDGGGGVGGPNVGGSGYGCSKAAVVRFTEGLARELERDGSGVLAFSMFPGFVRTAMTEGLVDTPARAEWQQWVVGAFATGVGRPPSDCAEATLRLLAIAGAELNGCWYDVDTDFEEVDRRRGLIARDQLLTMRLRPLPPTTH
jgi:NAD(P)-dependent dehydrogenase (short-subunit alcohol dehydrogenase family)